MGKLLVANGSPRGSKSNSKRYAAIFKTNWLQLAKAYLVTAKRHREICCSLADFANLLLVFPLYADSPPVPLMQFLKEVEQHSPAKKPTVHILINCGFLDPE